MGIPEGHESVAYLTAFDNHLILPEIGKCIVKMGESEIPHFDVISENGNFHCCIRVFENYYYSDNGNYTDTLNSEQLKTFVDWLNKKFPAPKINGTTWEVMSALCDFFDFELDYPKTNEMPDYMAMNSFKDD